MHVLADPATLSGEAEKIFSTMSPEERVGQIFMPAISSMDSDGTREMNPYLAGMLDRIHPGGVILFSRDLDSVEQVVRLTDALQVQGNSPVGNNTIPLFISIDQEGGYLTRLPFGPRMPGNMALGATRSPELTRSVASTIGKELSSLGINMNFAPVLDVETNQNNPVIGIRSFGSDPNLVSEMGDAYISGMHDAGMICSGKHFPGHGDVDIDSHIGLPREEHNRTRMNEVELVPFKSAIRSGVDAIMTAHIIFPAYDNSTNQGPDGAQIPTPATLSKPILTGLLREELRFDGLIITDAMMMKAITENYGTGDAAIRAVRAGADIILYPEPVEEAYEAVLTAYREDPEIQGRVDESVRRILGMKEKYGMMPVNSDAGASHDRDIKPRIAHAQNICLGDEAFAIEREAAEHSVTLITDNSHLIPLSRLGLTNITLFSPTMAFANETTLALNETLNTRGYYPRVTQFIYTNQSDLSEEQKTAIHETSLVILLTSSANATQRTDVYWMVQFAHSLLQEAGVSNVPVIGLALNQPYDIMYMRDIPVYFATYAGRPGGQNVQSAIKAIFGDISSKGLLPVDISDENGIVLFEAGTGIIR